MVNTQKLRCEVARLVDHGEYVYTLDLRPERPAPRFRPGQFLHLALDEYEPSGFWPESRIFSIASAPAQRDRLRISYSVRGQYTARMERELVEGSQLWVKLPYGEFFIEDTADVVLFAGGTGITAFAAFLDGLTSAFGAHVLLVYGARTASLLLYRDMLERRAASACLQLRYFVERPDAASSEMGAVVGRISADVVWPWIQAPRQAKYYLSGPPSMLRTLASDLRNRGIAGEAIRIDAWE